MLKGDSFLLLKMKSQICEFQAKNVELPIKKFLKTLFRSHSSYDIS